MKFRTIIVDDEVKALERLERLGHSIEEIEIVASFTKAMEALEYIKSNPVDLALLDIEMRKLSGLEMAEIIFDMKPHMDVVFVTAYDKYALEAFQVNAVGYLLKPINKEDLQQQIKKLMKKHQLKEIPRSENKLKVQCLGGFYCYKGSAVLEPMKWRTAKAEELLALLIHMKGQPIPKDKIIDMLWPEMDYDKGSKNLHSISYYIREALLNLGYEDVFLRSRGLYYLNMERMEVDVIELHRLLEYSPLKALPREQVARIIELSIGHYFEGKDYRWALSTNTWLQNKFEEVVFIEAERRISAGHESEAINLLNRLIMTNSCCEGAYQRLIKLYIKQENHVLAKQWYRKCELNLREELDEEPSEELKKLIK